jgi:N utilization substance protein A
MRGGRRCPNASLPGSRYCGLETHQALANVDSDEVSALQGLSPRAEGAQPTGEV